MIEAQCVTVPRRTFNNASRNDRYRREIEKMRHCALPSCKELTSSIKSK